MTRSQGFFILDGVRRAVASREAGRKTVPAIIYREGHPPERRPRMRLSSLFSPKISIDYDGRFFKIAPPIHTPISVEALGTRAASLGSTTHGEAHMSMRWQDETASAAQHLGWTVVASDGTDDYQGWGIHLLQRESLVPDPADAEVARDAIEERGDQALADQILGLNARPATIWAVMNWSYGSCGSCDSYEDRVSYETTPERLVEVFGELIEEVGGDEARARELFEGRKGW